jgi:dephospho-CoA kinase
MQSNIFSVGITGGIGSGKSLVSRIFSVLGVPVYDADSRAKWLMAHDKELKRHVSAHFGKEAYEADGSPNRSYLSRVIFSSEANRQQLNQLVHPRVGEDYNDWRTAHSGSAYTLKEAALLFESGSYRQLDVVINVNADVALRLTRVMLRDVHRSKEQVEAIMRKQWSDAERSARADYTILNDESKLLIPQVLKLHHKLLQRVAQQ